MEVLRVRGSVDVIAAKAGEPREDRMRCREQSESSAGPEDRTFGGNSVKVFGNGTRWERLR